VVWHGSHGFGILLSLFFLSFLFSSSSSKWRGDDDGKGELVFIAIVVVFVLYSDEKCIAWI